MNKRNRMGVWRHVPAGGMGWIVGGAILMMGVAQGASRFPEKQVNFRYVETDMEAILKEFSRWSEYTIINQGGQPSAMIDPLSGRPAQGRQIPPARGPVTVMSIKPVNLDQAFFILQEVLRGLGPGYVAIVNQEKKIINVLPALVTAQQLLRITVGVDPDRLPSVPDGETVKHIAFLKNLRVDAGIRSTVQLMMPNGATVMLNEQTNSMIMIGPFAHIQNVLKMLHALDAAFTAVATVRVHVLKYAVAKDLADTLRRIFGGGCTSSTAERGGTSGAWPSTGDPGSREVRSSPIFDHHHCGARSDQ